MIEEALLEELNEQIKHEFYASYLYLAMAAHFEAVNLPGFAHWMRLQHEEEHEHAMRIFDYIYERDERVTLQAIEQPPSNFNAPLDIFQQAYEHERGVTERINMLYGMAVENGDYATQSMLQWFVDEQVEEEKITRDVVDQLKMIGDDSVGLYMLDRELGAREPEEESGNE